MTTLLRSAARIERELVELRRDLHRHPELSFRETRTAGLVADRLHSLGLAVRTGVGRTGVVAEIGAGPPVVALRADMDALPIEEANDHDFRSATPGVMHACGHDAHVAMLIGAARLLAEDPPPAGTVRLLFQPSEEASDEEGRSGAARMIEDGAMDAVRAVFGLHIGAHLPAGHVLVSPGPIMAGSDRFTATAAGRSAHAANAADGVDAIAIAARFVLALRDAVERAVSADDGVLHIGTIRGGAAENVVADLVEMQGTLRYFEPGVRTVLRDELAAAAHEAGDVRIALVEGYPPVVNEPRMTDLVRAAAAATLGEDSVGPYARWMGAEDFAFLACEAPGCFFWLGAALDPPRAHHRPDFDIDESVLPRGAAVLAACALRALEEVR